MVWSPGLRQRSSRDSGALAVFLRKYLLSLRLSGMLRAKIHVDLFAHDQRSGIRQIDDDFQNVDVAELAWTARVDSAGTDKVSDGNDLSVKFATTKCGRTHEDALPDANSFEILLVHLGAHAQGRDIAEHEQRQLQRWHRQFTFSGVDLQHGAIDRR